MLSQSPSILLNFHPPKNRSNRKKFFILNVQRRKDVRVLQQRFTTAYPFILIFLSSTHPLYTFIFIVQMVYDTRMPFLFRAVVNYLRDEDASDVALLCVCVAWRTRYPADVAVATAAAGPLIAAFDAVTNEAGTRKSGEDKWKSRRETILG